MITINDYFDGTIGNFIETNKVPNKAKLIRQSTNKKGEITSVYFIYKEYLYRISDHWGGKINNCCWNIKGRNNSCPCYKWQSENGNPGSIIGFIKLSHLRRRNVPSVFGTY